MKLFKAPDVRTLALQKWKSVELLETEKEHKRQRKVKIETKKEEETKHFWDNEELYEPLSSYMETIDLPPEVTSSYFTNSDRRSDKGTY